MSSLINLAQRFERRGRGESAEIAEGAGLCVLRDPSAGPAFKAFRQLGWSTNLTNRHEHSTVHSGAYRNPDPEARRPLQLEVSGPFVSSALYDLDTGMHRCERRLMPSLGSRKVEHRCRTRGAPNADRTVQLRRGEIRGAG